MKVQGCKKGARGGSGSDHRVRPSADRLFFCGVLGRCVGGFRLVFAKQQALVLIELLLAAAEINGHGGQCTGDGGQRSNIALGILYPECKKITTANP